MTIIGRSDTIGMAPRKDNGMHLLSRSKGPNAEDSREQVKGEIDDKIELLKTLARNFLVEVETLNMFQSEDIRRGLNFYDEVRRFETSLIERALLQTTGHQRRAARLLGLGATTLHAKIKQYNIKFMPDQNVINSDGSDDRAEFNDVTS